MTSGLAMLLVRACGAEKFVPWTLLERAEASCVFMLELNFHSWSSIYSSQWFACLASHTSRSISSVTHPSFFPFQMRLTSMSDCYRAGALGGFSQMFERWMMSQFDRLLRGSMTSGLAMLLVRACGAEKFVPWTLLERAEASCVFMLELNFRSGSSIYSSQWFASLASHTSRSISSVTHPSFFPFQMRLASRSDCYRAGALGGFSQMFERWMMSQFDRLLSVDHFRDVSVWTADIETLGAIYIDCGVPVMLGGSIGSETR
ncbi:hypothetical protein F2Q69_00052974 [Brassica cretica]|uniref:Uncharacterized protein n=1 Tax=Brassica cretica TaxID=69181 RepID=A0A8S9MSS4_BRACR|nr:hypothetical protein F2Q69_00052974 [Brassica cretica]